MKKEVFLFNLVIFIVLLSSFSLAVDIFTADILGNLKPDFSPEELVYIHGEGFNPNDLAFIGIERPDGNFDYGLSFIDSSGEFVYVYDLDGIKGIYYVIASDGINTAGTFFSDAAIWTTKNDCGTSQQDINHYSANESVYIDGDGFSAGNYSWEIKGKPGGASCDPNQIVASGDVSVNSSGAFCFNAYTVQSNDCGEYQVKVGVKGDNYRVEGGACTKDKDCGEESSELTCFANNVTNVTYSPACLNGTCTSTNSSVFVQNCGLSSSGLTCIGNNLTNITTLRGCSLGECFNTTVISIVQFCDLGCQNNSCISAVCGNGIIDGNEECDDGNQNNFDSCRNNCTLPFCGDSITDEEEECDNSSCQKTECDNLDGCIENDYYDYQDVLNVCLGNCSCENNSCSIINISRNDIRCCDDEDNDSICDDEDECPDSKPKEDVDENGCDPFQFCEKFYCGLNCFFADFKNDEQNVTKPNDCTVVLIANEGTLQPKCVPLGCE